MLQNNQYNPDVLTCLANLSSDEVFTPPQLANQLLDMLPNELWSNKNVTFLDPACKSGVFLREIAKRLIIGLEKVIPDRQERLNHIYKNQLFGIAITEITSLISRRTVYCSKNAMSKYSVYDELENEQGNIVFNHTKHDFKNKKCIYCGASQSVYDRGDDLETHAYQFIHSKKPEEIFKMKFDVIIGNPPYQLSDGGAQASAIPLYHKFVQQAKKLKPRYLCMIIPSRWFTGGKGLDSFRKEMLNDNRLRVIHDFINASECFPGVEIKGGVCYFLWEKESKGLCKVISHEGGSIISELERPLLERDCDIFIRYNEAIKILHKIQKFNEISFGTIVHPAMTFGFRTYFKEFDSLEYKENHVKVYANKSQGYIKSEKIQKGMDYVDKWKVIIPEATGIGNMSEDRLKPLISEPYSICTETYIMNGPYESKEVTENVISYINSKFFHFLLGLKKITQHTSNKVYSLIPIQDFNVQWTDEKLYSKYGLTQDEIDFIESMIRPMDLNNEED